MAPISGVRVTKTAARLFQLRAEGLVIPLPALGEALSHLGFVQIDPLNICGRMHDLILRNRLKDYREGDLMRHLHGESVQPLPAKQRVGFEHHHPDSHNLVAFPLEAWPHLLGAMRTRAKGRGAWSGRLTAREKELIPAIFAEIASRGPLSSEDFKDSRRAEKVVWGTASLAKSALQKLFFHGRLLIAARDNQRRHYDLPERVLPPEILARPEAPVAETTRWLASLKLRQRRLATLTRVEWAAVEDSVTPVAVEGCPQLYCLTSDLPWLEEAQSVSTSAPASPVRLLAPLDPLIYDRRVTARLWDFDYTWEAYTPPAKRVRGHYALPILAGTELVGHVEPKADREHGRLTVASRSVRRGYRTGTALDELARWLHLRR